MSRKKRKVAPFVGIVDHYRDYRYGTRRPVYNPAKGSPARILGGNRREHVVSQTVELMKGWMSSPFEFEGSCRHGLRSGFCIEGESWTRADIEAEQIVAEALRRMRAVRPDWEAGQRYYTQSPDQCAWCQGPIEPEDQSRGRRFCCADCARSAVEHMNRKTNHHYGAVLRSALRLIAKDEARPRACLHCGTMFRADYTAAKFCSARCHGLHQVGDRAYQDRDCEHCGATFHQISPTQKYCSQSCSRQVSLAREAEEMAGVQRPCKCCDEPFQPTTRAQVYCSPKCQQSSGKAKYAEKKKAAIAERRANRCCAWCGETFTPKSTAGMYCSDRCNGDASLARRGWVPKVLSPRAFDHYFTVPANSRPPWATPERFDEMLGLAA